MNKESTGKIFIAGRMEMKGFDLLKRVYDPKGIAPTLSTCQGGNIVPKIYYEKAKGV